MGYKPTWRVHAAIYCTQTVTSWLYLISVLQTFNTSLPSSFLHSFLCLHRSYIKPCPHSLGGGGEATATPVVTLKLTHNPHLSPNNPTTWPFDQKCLLIIRFCLTDIYLQWLCSPSYYKLNHSSSVCSTWFNTLAWNIWATLIIHWHESCFRHSLTELWATYSHVNMLNVICYHISILTHYNAKHCHCDNKC